MGYGMVNGFIDHLYTSLGTTSNYSAIANLHTLQIATRYIFSIFTSRILATDFYTVTTAQQSSLHSCTFNSLSRPNCLPYNHFEWTE
jgi:hypothetical protein